MRIRHVCSRRNAPSLLLVARSTHSGPFVRLFATVDGLPLASKHPTATIHEKEIPILLCSTRDSRKLLMAKSLSGVPGSDIKSSGRKAVRVQIPAWALSELATYASILERLHEAVADRLTQPYTANAQVRVPAGKASGAEAPCSPFVGAGRGGGPMSPVTGRARSLILKCRRLESNRTGGYPTGF